MMNSIVSAAAEVDASFIAGCKLGVSLLHGDLKCQVLMHKCFKYCTFWMESWTCLSHCLYVITNTTMNAKWGVLLIAGVMFYKLKWLKNKIFNKELGLLGW